MIRCIWQYRYYPLPGEDGVQAQEGLASPDPLSVSNPWHLSRRALSKSFALKRWATKPWVHTRPVGQFRVGVRGAVRDSLGPGTAMACVNQAQSGWRSRLVLCVHTSSMASTRCRTPAECNGSLITADTDPERRAFGPHNERAPTDLEAPEVLLNGPRQLFDKAIQLGRPRSRGGHSGFAAWPRRSGPSHRHLPS